MSDAICTENSNEFEVVFKDPKVAEARRRWRRLKNVGVTILRTSLTKPEADLLNFLENKKEPETSLAISKTESTIGAPNAHSMLRRSITLRRESLTLDELQFLQGILEADEVSDDALSNSRTILETDELYRTSSLMSSQTQNDISASMMNLPKSISELPVLRDPGICQMPKENLQQDSLYRMELWRTLSASLFKSDLQNEKMDVEHKEQGEVVKMSNDIIVDSALISYFKKLNCSTAFVEDFDEEGTDKSDNDEEEEMKEVPPTVQFSILGTSADAASVCSHVMSPPLMDILTSHMPYAIQADNFWLKYSLVRDGASMDTLISKVCSSSHTILAIETIGGEVFGSFTSTPWRHMGNTYYGSGESFLWRMRQPRLTLCDSLLDRTRLESDIEVFKWTSKNRNVQLSTQKKLVIGGGEPDLDIDRRVGMSKGEMKQEDKENKWDFGLALNSDLSSGTSGKCVTFGSPGLSKYGATFEVSNLEVWTLTPVTDLGQAQKLEHSRQFVYSNIQSRINRKVSMAA